MLPAAAATPVLAVSPDIVISQVYGGGGNSGATYTHDFVELFNRGSSPVAVTNWTIQYTSATGTGNFGSATNLITILAGTINPGQYLLVQEATNAAVGLPLPTPDVTDGSPIAMAAGAGKVALVNTTTPLGCNGGSTPCSAGALAAIVDLVGYGTGTSGANFFEGAGPAPTISATLADFRGDGGCSDTDQNGTDFAAATPGPRNSASATHTCGVVEDEAPAVDSTFPAQGATNFDVGDDLTVTFSEAVDVTDPWFTLQCSTSGSVTAIVSGGPITFTLNPATNLVNGESCTLTIVAANVSDQDGNDPPDDMELDFVVGFTPFDVCAQTFTPIYSIQGTGPVAAITGNVTTQGVVVGAFDDPVGIGGFYIQDPVGDGDAETSDGLFVFTNNINTVAVGDLVRVSGFARERFFNTPTNTGQTSLHGSDSNAAPVPAASIIDCGTGEVAATDVTMPFESATFLERYEGMLVNFSQPLVISEYFNYDQFGEIVLALPLDGEERAFSGTALDEPGADANARTLANQLRRITLDDNRGGSNPPVLRHPNGEPFSLTNRFRGGDTVANATGVLGWDFSLYRIFPTAPADYTELNPRPTARADVGGTLTAAAMNTLNFFITPDYPNTNPVNPLDNKCGGNGNLECRGHDFDQPLEFTRQRDKLLQALAGLDADIIGLNEIENSPGVDALTDPTNGIVAGLNAMPGVGPYAAINTGVIGTDAIRVGLIYRSDVVAPVGDFKILNSSVDPRFIDTRSRPVLAQTFEDLATGARITVAVNHLKSKGSACTGTAAPPLLDPDIGDGQGNCPQTRKLAAQALVDWLATDPTSSGDRDYLILGDLNSYAKEDPIDAIKAGPDDLAGTADDYTNLIESYLGDEAYSYVFDGQSGYLDHALASPTLVGQVTGAAEWHINADEPDVVDYDTSFKPPSQEALYEPNAYRASDHDPVIVGLDLLNYEFEGFQAPVDNPPIVNEVKAGQGVPVKFDLADGLGLDVLFGVPSATQFPCEGGAATDAVEATAGGSSGLQLDPVTGLYTYVWKTDKAWANQCRTFEITFDDGAYRRALFTFTK